MIMLVLIINWKKSIELIVKCNKVYKYTSNTALFVMSAASMRYKYVFVLHSEQYEFVKRNYKSI